MMLSALMLEINTIDGNVAAAWREECCIGGMLHRRNVESSEFRNVGHRSCSQHHSSLRAGDAGSFNEPLCIWFQCSWRMLLHGTILTASVNNSRTEMLNQLNCTVRFNCCLIYCINTNIHVGTAMHHPVLH